MPYKNVSDRRKQQQKYKRAIVLRLHGLKAGLGCCRCDETDPRCLDFHHRDKKTKSFTIGLHPWSHSWSRTLAEIAKCDCLCSNCHRKHGPAGSNASGPGLDHGEALLPVLHRRGEPALNSPCPTTPNRSVNKAAGAGLTDGCPKSGGAGGATLVAGHGVELHSTLAAPPGSSSMGAEPKAAPVKSKKVREGETPYEDAHMLIWDKETNGMGYHYRRRYECIIFAWKKAKRRLRDLGKADVFRYKRVTNGYPTEKPAALITELITQSLRVGETLCDPFAGSGSVGSACPFDMKATVLLNDNSPMAIQTMRERLGGLPELSQVTQWPQMAVQP